MHVQTRWEILKQLYCKCSRFACVHSCVQLTQLVCTWRAWCSCYIQSHWVLLIVTTCYKMSCTSWISLVTNDCITHTHTQPNRCMEAHRSLGKPCMPMPAPIMVCIDRQGQTVCSNCHHWTPNHTWPFMWVDNQHSNTSTRSNYKHHSHAVGCGAGSRSSITQLACSWSCSGWGPSTDGKTSGLSLSCFRVLCVAFAVRADR